MKVPGTKSPVSLPLDGGDAPLYVSIGLLAIAGLILVALLFYITGHMVFNGLFTALTFSGWFVAVKYVGTGAIVLGFIAIGAFYVSYNVGKIAMSLISRIFD